MIKKNKITNNLVIGKRGYSIRKSSISIKQLKKIKKDLTVAPFVNDKFSQRPPPFLVYLESINKIYVPKYYGLKNYGEPDLNRLQNHGDNIFISFKGKLRDIQRPVVNEYIKTAKEKGGGLICLPCGFGKTILSLYIISLLSKKTLVVCHKEFLLNQWKERIKTFLPDAKIGIIQQKKVDIENKDIVLGMLQSIAMRDYPDGTFSSFGFVVFDECHHLGAEVFSRALPKLSTKFLLGLSATPNRKDGLSKVFEWYLGDMVYCVKEREPDTVSVKLIEYFSNDENYAKEEIGYGGRIMSSKMVTNVCNYQPRIKIIISELKKLIKEGRRILILSERRKHLVDIYEKVTNQKIATCGYYVGGMKQQDLDISSKKQIVLGTFHLASEGMDVPELNTIILASPKSDIVQSIGRIFRQKKSERTHIPLIIDIIDVNIPIFKRQFSHRNRIYKKNKYSISRIKLSKKGTSNNIVQQLNYNFKNLGCLIEE